MICLNVQQTTGKLQNLDPYGITVCMETYSSMPNSIYQQAEILKERYLGINSKASVEVGKCQHAKMQIYFSKVELLLCYPEGYL